MKNITTNNNKMNWIILFVAGLFKVMIGLKTVSR